MKLHKRNLWRIGYPLLLGAYTLYVLLDTFVLVKTYTPQAVSVVSAQTDTAQADTMQADTTQAVSTQTDADTLQYQDDDIDITITEHRVEDTTVYVAHVTLSRADLLKTALAKGTYGKNMKEKTSTIAAENDAILAINGDFYGAQEEGFVIRNGVLYRSDASDDTQALVIAEDGSFRIVEEETTSADQLLAEGAAQVLSFGPALVENGSICVTPSQEVGKAKADNPRTAIGIISDLEYVFVVSDGRTEESEGLSLYELATFMEQLGVSCAYNLDGGGSSTMVFNGVVINQPTTNGNRIKERSVSDIVYIGS